MVRFLIFCLLFISQIVGATNSDPVSAYLGSLKQIRVFIIEAPGFGHQVTALTWVQRLRELGYTGRIELVIDGQARQKLEKLLPGVNLNSNPDFTSVSFAQLTQQLQTGVTGLVDLAIVPAEDWFDSRSMIRMRMPDRPLTKAKLGAKNILRMQPSGWKDGFRSMEREDGKAEGLEDLSPLMLRLPVYEKPVESVSGLMSWLTEILPNTRTHERLEIAKMISDRTVDQFPYYCAHSEKVVYLSRLALGVIRAKHSRPVRIWVTSEMTDFQWRNLVNSITRNAAGSEAVLMTDMLTGNSEVIGQGSYKVHVVRLSNASPRLIRYLSETADLPPAVTGKFSQNIMFQAGRPFIELKYLDEVQEALNLSGDVLTAAESLTREINEAMATAAHVPIEASLSRFWKIAATDEAKRQYAVKQVHALDEDLVYASLKRMAQFTRCEEEFL